MEEGVADVARGRIRDGRFEGREEIWRSFLEEVRLAGTAGTKAMVVREEYVCVCEGVERNEDWEAREERGCFVWVVRWGMRM